MSKPKLTWNSLTAWAPEGANITPPSTPAAIEALRAKVLAKYFEIRDHGHGLKVSDAPKDFLFSALVVTLQQRVDQNIPAVVAVDQIFAELLA